MLSDQDRDAVARIRAGDHAAFRALYEGALDLLLRFAYSYTHSVAAAQDIVADVFVILWERRATWDPVHGIRAYLLSAVRNRALDVMRHERIVTRVHESPQGDDVTRATMSAAIPTADTVLDVEEQRAQLRRAIRALSPDRRRALMLRWQEGLSPVEIATAMGMPRSAVDQLVSRAIKALREMVRE